VIDGNGNARLTNFTFATMASDGPTNTTDFIARSGIRWMSPELFDPEMPDPKDSPSTKESDYYALGMVIYEVLSGRRPFAAHTDLEIAVKALKGERPGRPKGEEGRLFTDDIWDILEHCWKPRPCDRISPSVVLPRLEGHPPLPRPSFIVDGDVEPTGNGSLSYRSGADRSDPDSGMFSPSPRTASLRGGWLARWGIFKATTRNAPRVFTLQTMFRDTLQAITRGAQNR
jgi:serine/threonine protein kinase